MVTLLIVKVVSFSFSLVIGICYTSKRKKGLAIAWYIAAITWFMAFLPDFLSFTYPW